MAMKIILYVRIESEYIVKKQLAPALALITLTTLATPLARGEDVNAGCTECVTEATKLFARGNNDGALEKLEAWQERCPRSLSLQLLLNTLYLRKGNTGKALAAARKATVIDPQSMLAHYQAAITLNMMQDAGALQEYEKVVTLDPGNHDAWLALAEIYRARKDETKAEEAAQKARNLDPATRASRLKLVKSLDRAGKTQGAREELDRLSKDPAVTDDACLSIGESVLAMGYLGEAAIFLERYNKSVTPQAGLKAQLLLLLSDYLRGRPASHLTSLSPQAKAASQALYQGTGEAEEKASLPSYFSAFCKGIKLLASGDYQNACASLEEAMRQEAALAPARYYLAFAALKSGDNMDCMSTARDCQKYPDLASRARALELRARVKEATGSKQNLQTLLNQVEADSRSENAASDSVLALVYYDLSVKDLTSARARLATVKTEGAEESLARAALALKEGNREEAERCLADVTRLAPGDGEAALLKRELVIK